MVIPSLRHSAITLPLNFGFGWAMFLGGLQRVIARGGGAPDMVVSCQEQRRILHPFFRRPSRRFRGVNYSRFHCIARGGGIMLRRLISLIYWDWVPDELVSSWSCLNLQSGV